MRLRIRHRLRVALMVILCLLFQQLALAGYTCPLEQMPTEMAVMAEHCAEMGMQQAQDNATLCDKHCSPDVSTPADHAKLSVPALMLPPLVFATVLATPMTHVAVQAEIPIARSDPPPRLRFCSLLI
ncbi:hypothetical protein [Thermomonas sp.]|uniref:hypothetical protein n=1 Tax=Thermomonas sp. TaxID=1971895 RepID=UPI0035B44576